MLNLKKQLQDYLEFHGMTAAQLSRKSGISKQAISGWLSGNNPRDVRQVKKAADALSTTVDSLMFGTAIEVTKERQLSHLIGEEWLSGLFEIKIRRVK